MNTDCLHFTGRVPCGFHKLDGRECGPKCPDAERPTKKILLVKTGRAGDVIRTAPILSAFPKGSSVEWLTQFPVIVNMIEPPNDISLQAIDSEDSAEREAILMSTYDLVVNLDKDRRICGFVAMMQTVGGSVDAEYLGFGLGTHGETIAADSRSDDKLLAGVDDGFMRAWNLSYIEQAFAQVGAVWNCEMATWREVNRTHADYRRIAIIPGASPAWPTRSYSLDKWLAAVDLILSRDQAATVDAIAGPIQAEVELCRDLASAFSRSRVKVAVAEKHVDWFRFLADCDTAICHPSLGMNVANQLGLRVVLLNNVFSRYEFLAELAPGSAILEPPLPCVGCYKSKCETRCLDLHVSPEQIADAVLSPANHENASQSAQAAPGAPISPSDEQRGVSESDPTQGRL